jgi:hypothetical protein
MQRVDRGHLSDFVCYEKIKKTCKISYVCSKINISHARRSYYLHSCVSSLFGSIGAVYWVLPQYPQHEYTYITFKRANGDDYTCIKVKSEDDAHKDIQIKSMTKNVAFVEVYYKNESVTLYENSYIHRNIASLRMSVVSEARSAQKNPNSTAYFRMSYPLLDATGTHPLFRIEIQRFRRKTKEIMQYWLRSNYYMHCYKRPQE